MNQKENAQKYVSDYKALNYRLSQTENAIVHFTFGEEIAFLKRIVDGDPDCLQMLDFNMYYKEDYSGIGTLSYSALKQMEYSAVIGIALASRAAIIAGVDEHKVYDLSDLYLQTISQTRVPDRYALIYKESLEHFLTEINKVKNKSTSHPHVTATKQYIRKNLNQNISVVKIAKHVGVTPNYLSALFSKTEHMTIKDFILHERVQASEMLLLQSNYSISEIASYLGFYSTSHFGQVFKKIHGMSPTKFRKKGNQTL